MAAIEPYHILIRQTTNRFPSFAFERCSDLIDHQPANRHGSPFSSIWLDVRRNSGASAGFAGKRADQ